MRQLSKRMQHGRAASTMFSHEAQREINRLRCILALGCAFFLQGCMPAGGGPALQSSVYYPLKSGTDWTYQGPDHKRTIRVAKHELVDKKLCALIETKRDDELIAKEHVYVTGKGIFALMSNGQKLPAPMPILRLPPIEGRKWHVNIKKSGQRTRGTYIIGREDVVVPFGKFQSVKLSVTFRGEQVSDNVKVRGFTRWFAKSVGIVKEEISTGQENVVYELIAFDEGNE